MQSNQERTMEVQVPPRLKKEKSTVEKVFHPKKKKAKAMKHAYFTVIWLTVTGVMAFYTYLIVSQYISSAAVPGSTVSYFSENNLTLPQVTICNWNQGTANYTKLQAINCVDFRYTNTAANCLPLWKPLEVPTTHGTFNCYVFNDNANAPEITGMTGYSGSIAIIFEIQRGPPDWSIRNGVQVSLTNPGADVCGDDSNPACLDYIVWNEIRFAPSRLDTFYGINYLTTTFNNESDPIKQGPFPSYDAKGSMTSLPITPTDNLTAYVGVSFAFQTLSTTSVVYDTTYTGVNLLGDFAGMIGTLMGLDTIKVMASIPIIFVAIRKREFERWADHFNG